MSDPPADGPTDPPADGLTDELAAQIHAELELGLADDTREQATVRGGAGEGVELVLHDDDGEAPDVVVALTAAAARDLARALAEAADGA